jgi:uncharacterized protein
VKSAIVAEWMAIYIDTSALAKRYLAEKGSDAFDAFLIEQVDDCLISPLVATELESVVQRLLRQRLIDKAYAAQVRQDFANDLSGALWSMRPFPSAGLALAGNLLRKLSAPLATLDALHLATAIEFDCSAIATSDRQLAKAAAEHGLEVHPFSV